MLTMSSFFGVIRDASIARAEIRERGMPERINRTALGAMMARGPLHDGIMSLFRGVPLRPNQVG